MELGPKNHNKDGILRPRPIIVVLWTLWITGSPYETLNPKNLKALNPKTLNPENPKPKTLKL